MTPESAWRKISVSRLAHQLNISRTAIYKWQKSARGIPAERAIEIEGVTDIDRKKLRPDLWPPE
jgi:DNA-binding transcriptional regulator YdaS (Cro superfamily)